VLIVDDVITAGTAVREAAEIIRSNGAHLNGIAVAMDRQEKGTGNLSAIQEIEQIYQIKVVSIISLQDIVDYLMASENEQLQPYLDAVVAYREEYGISA
jgi:orotate phosphoribosyltransferase